MAPLSVFHVQKGKRYRFRLINSASNVCPFLFQVSFKQRINKIRKKFSCYFCFCFDIQTIINLIQTDRRSSNESYCF